MGTTYSIIYVFRVFHLRLSNGAWEAVDGSVLSGAVEDSWDEAMENDKRKRFEIGNGIVCCFISAGRSAGRRVQPQWIVKRVAVSHPVEVPATVDVIQNDYDIHPVSLLPDVVHVDIDEPLR